MLSSRNRSLKRRSRFMAFFIIIFAGTYYRFKQMFKKMSDFTSTEEFINESDTVPPAVKTIYQKMNQAKGNAEESGWLGSKRLPAEDYHELKYR